MSVWSSYQYTPSKRFYRDDYKRQLQNSEEVFDLTQNIERTKIYLNQHTYTIGLDYDMTTKHSIGAIYNGFTYGGSESATNYNSIVSNLNTNNFNIQTDSRTDKTSKANSLGLNYNFHPDTLGTSFMASVDWSHYGSTKNDFYDEQFTFNNSMPREFKRTIEPNNIDLTTYRIDYSALLKKILTFATGFYLSNSKTANQLLFEQQINTEWQKDNTRSNQFRYTEKISAAYINLDKNTKKWTFKAGIRVEQVVTEGISVEKGDKVVDRHYLDMFPNVSVGYNVLTDLVLSSNYSYRIGRPLYQDLDPFLFYIDLLSYLKGNPFLKPEYTKSWETALTYKKVASLKFGYSNTKDAMRLVVTQLNDSSKVSVASTQNLDNIDQYTLSLNIPYQTAHWLTYNAFGYQFNKTATQLSGVTLNINRPLWYVYSYNQVTFSKKTSAEFTAQYSSSGAEGIFVFQPIFTASAGIKHSFYNDKLKLSLSIQDMFKTDKRQVTTQINNLNLSYNSFYDAFHIRLAATMNLHGSFKEGKSQLRNDKEFDRIKQ